MDNSEINNRKNIKKLLILATLAGDIMLRSGAEIYRVEDTVVRICKSRKDIKYVDAYIVPTGIFISLEYKGELISYIKRVKTISIDLNKITLVNEFSRNFVNSQMSMDDGLKELKRINKVNSYTNLTKTFFGSLAAAFFCVLLGGSFLDFIASFTVSFIVLTIINLISKFNLTFFINNLFGAILAAAFSHIFVKIGIGGNLDKVIIGSIMCLVPGVPITNATRDTMSGDFLSGLSRGMEAVFSAIAIALGVGIILNFYAKGVF
ncbi:threonine/serine ThrE exporter family protein [Tissierella praeacuta]|uniref:threonine/serine ThrE exporter family protein n=1 Tax=Tissierella praeacuta TaxID=43131 RepID=UPI001C11AD42|nr:threonine/serine exporter family protein [Tissierella praeacuta]MBU5257409.1 threonine/serine exporter family protein [Tissierella praeacuta]